MAKRKLTLKYSGDASIPFWKMVDDVCLDQGGDGYYRLAVDLQDLEQRIVSKINSMLIRRGAKKRSVKRAKPH